MRFANATLVCMAVSWLACGESTAAHAVADQDGAEADVKLEVRGLQPIYHRFGPVRKDLACLPGERLYFRCDLHGCGLDGRRRTELDVSWRIVNAEGKVRQAASHPVKAFCWAREDAFVRLSERCILDDTCRPGKYTLELAIEDRITGQEANASLPFTVKPPVLAIVSPRFYCDEKCTAAAPLSGVINQAIFCECEIVGEDRSQAKVHLSVSIDVVDAAGKSAWGGPDVFDLVLEGDRLPANISQHPMFHTIIALCHPGKYALRVAVVDKATARMAELELPLEVHDPQEPNDLAAK
ncbi:MAG TPA: hypothetical protein VHC19_13310 [Pirellulales bacterium]|nr:hypothetical protein [Pirellulales bacterium]